MDESIESFRSEFYVEAKEILEKANAETLKAESDPSNTGLLNSIFRGIHTIKGGASMFEMMDVSEFAHELEGVLNILREGIVQLNPELADVILTGIDSLLKMFASYSQQKTVTIDTTLIERFQAICKDPSSIMTPKEEIKEIKEELIEETKEEAKHEEIHEEATTAAKPEISEAQTMRIDERKVEQFTNIVGELLIARNTYDYLLQQFQRSEHPLEVIQKNLKANLYQFSRLTNDIHHGVISLRMVPIRGIFAKFNRIVRDVSRKQKKPIVMITEGDDIEIDKKIGDILSDPLVHLVRNACDHGIELPEIRKNSGKSEQGKVLLKASQEGSTLIIKVSDDGQGVNRKILLQKALERGFKVTPDDDEALLKVLFEPGFSTKTEITDISGRGVGMDVVKTSVESIGGHVSITSVEGKGTETSLSIPMTMGINGTLIVVSHGESYAIPLDYILETLKAKPEQIRSSGSQTLFYYRGQVLPVERLDNILGIRQEENTSYKTLNEIPMVIIQTRSKKFALIVDRLDKHMEVAIKPLPEAFDNIDVISGVSIMGDGKVFLVLNPEKFFLAS